MLVVIAGYVPALCYIIGIIFTNFLVKLRDAAKRMQDLQLKLPYASPAQRGHMSVGEGPKQGHQVD